MSEPQCPQKYPYGLELDAGVYFWCKCGASANQPFCDGVHAGSEFVPVRFEVKEAETDLAHKYGTARPLLYLTPLLAR